MTKRDFFIMIIKIFGLFSIVTSLFSVLPSNILFALSDVDVFSIFWVVLALFIHIAIFVLLIFYSDKVVTLLKLDKGFDDDKIELGNVLHIDIIKIGTFIIGGLLMLENIPEFLSHTLFAFKGNMLGIEYTPHDKLYWLISGLNIVIGYLLLTNHNFIAKILKSEKKVK